MIKQLIKSSIEELFKIDFEKGPLRESGNRIIFPAKKDNTRRISEQEARFLFVKQLENQTDFYYSIETPTTETYKFTGKTEISGNVDVCLYQKIDNCYKRTNIIEFKAHNVDFQNDFQKLEKECPDNINYFVHLIETYNRRTIESLIKKYRQVLQKDKHIVVCLCILTMKGRYAEKNRIIFFDKTNWEIELNELIN